MSKSKQTFMSEDSDYLASIIEDAIQTGPPDKKHLTTIELLRKHEKGIGRMLKEGWTATQVAELFSLKLGADVRAIHIGRAAKSTAKKSSNKA